MRPIRSLAVYVGVVFVGGALLAPWLYDLTQWAAGHWHGLAGLAANPFHRFVLRCILGLAVIGLWPLLRDCGMLQWREIGLAGDGLATSLANVTKGFGIGLLSLALVAGLAICCGGRTANFSHNSQESFHFLGGTVLASIIVAILEELIFRGALFGILRKTFPWPVALALSSGVYAAVHFLQKAPPPAHIDWLSGLAILPKMFQTPADGLAPVPAFFTLLVAGSILALAYQRTGTLYMSMGLHAGWIFWLKSYRFLTNETSGGKHWIWGTDKLIDGWLPLLILSLFLALILSGKWVSAKPRKRALKG